MAEEFDSVSVDQLQTITLALEQYLSVANVNGKLYKSRIGDLVTFITPFLSAVGASGLVFPDANNVIANPTTTIKASIVGAGTFTWTGGTLTTTGLLNIIATNTAGTAWVIVKSIDTNGLVTKTQYDSDILSLQGGIQSIKDIPTFNKQVDAYTAGIDNTYRYYDATILSNVANQAYVYVNPKLVVNSQSQLKTIIFRSDTSRSQKFWVVEKMSTANDFKAIQSFNINVVPGLNFLPKDLTLYPNQTIGIYAGAQDRTYYREDSDASRKYNYILGDITAGNISHFELAGGVGGFIDIGFIAHGQAIGTGDVFIRQVYGLLNVPNKVQVDRITIEGQSNALGVALTSGLSVSPFVGVEINWLGSFNRVFIWDRYSETYSHLKIGVDNMASWDSRYISSGGTATASSFGPEVGLALGWLLANPKGQLYIHKNLGDGLAISAFQKGGSIYTDAQTQMTKADTWLNNRGYNAKDIGFVWVQGESDNGGLKAYYLDALRQLITSKKADNLIKGNTIICITQINSTSAGYSAQVASAKIDFVTETPLAFLVSYTNNMNGDNLHLNATGQIRLGLAASEVVFFLDPINYQNIGTKANWTS